MVDPNDIVTFPRGKFITTATAAKNLNLDLSRIRQFIESGSLKAIQIEDGGTFFIPLDEFTAFAKRPRKPGRPSSKKGSQK